MYKGTSPNLTAITSSSSQHSSVPESERELEKFYGLVSGTKLFIQVT